MIKFIVLDTWYRVVVQLIFNDWMKIIAFKLFRNNSEAAWWGSVHDWSADGRQWGEVLQSRDSLPDCLSVSALSFGPHSTSLTCLEPLTSWKMDVGTTQLGIILDSDALEGPKLNFPSHSWSNRSNRGDTGVTGGTLKTQCHIGRTAWWCIPMSLVNPKWTSQTARWGGLELGFASQLFH